MRLQQTLDKYLPLIGNMIMPAFIFSVALFAFLYKGEFLYETALYFHWGFYILSIFSFVVLLNFNLSKLLFYIVITVLNYVLINYIKNLYGANFLSELWYQYLGFLLPINLLLFYIYPGKRFLSKKSLLTILGIISEYAIAELLVRESIPLSFIIYNTNIIPWILFGFLIAYSLVKSIINGSLFDYTILFSSLSILMGYKFSVVASGLSLFFFISQLFCCIYLVYTLIHNHYYDELTGFYSRNSYLIQSKHFPLKYSLGLICIDNYDKLKLTIGSNKLNIVTLMIADVLSEMCGEDTVYRYAVDQFIVLYKKDDKKETFNKLEDIRRTIAGLNFEYSSKQKPLKLTVSCSVSEKKRSDASAVEVLMRADKAMRKTLKFSHNVTSQG